MWGEGGWKGGEEGLMGCGGVEVGGDGMSMNGVVGGNMVREGVEGEGEE